MSYIFIGAHARSGSTFLCRLLRQINEIKVYNEIFHFHQSIIEQHLFGDYQEIASQLNLPEDPGKARSELVFRHQEYLEALSKLNKDKPLAFKVFPKHLPDKLLGEVVCESRLIVLLRRNLLQSYISNVISTRTQKWAGVDTSREKIEFSSIDFANHVCRVINYYDNVRSLAKKHRKKIVSLNYETLAMSADPVQLVSSIFAESLGSRVVVNNHRVKVFKQDKRSKATEKVLNAEEMMEYLRTFDLSILDSGLVNCVDSGYMKVEFVTPKESGFSV